MVDCCPIDGSDPVDNIELINNEVAKYGDALTTKPVWIVLNKIDLLADKAQELEALKTKLNERFESVRIFEISSVAQTNTKELCGQLMKKLQGFVEEGE